MSGIDYENHSIFTQSLADVYIQKILAEIDSIEVIPHEFSEKYVKKKEKLIKMQKKTYYPLICTAGRRAACIGAAILIAGGAAMSVEAIRNKVVKFISKNVIGGMDNVYIEYDSSADYPMIIEHEYTIDVPEGFVFDNDWFYKTKSFIDKRYVNKDKQIQFQQHTVGDNFHNFIDNERHKKEYYTDENGVLYTVYWEENGNNIILWERYGYWFEVLSNINKEQALDICKSLK